MEIIKGYCCHSKEVCSWPSFLSLLSKVNRLNRTARITKRGASLAWIHPPKKKKSLWSFLDSQEPWIFRTAVLERIFYWKPFNSLCAFCCSRSDSRRWDLQHLQTLSTTQQLLALGHWNVGAHLAHKEAAGQQSPALWHPKLHFQGCLRAWLHKVQAAQQFHSQELLNCCILLFNKPSPNCCNYLFSCLLTPLTSPRMCSHLNTAHPSQPSSH